MFRNLRLRPFLWASVLVSLCWLWNGSAQAKLFQGDGKDYVVYVKGKLWIFSKFANTNVTVRNLSNNTVVWSPTFSAASQQASQSFNGVHLRVTSDQPINVATGNLLAHNAPQNNNLSYATYLISENGSRLGKSFIGFVSSDLIVFCHKSSVTGNNPRVTIEDLTDLSGSDNDDKFLTTNNSTVDKPEVTIWQRGGFDDDLVRVTTNQDCSVMAGHNVHAKAIGDWSVMPPSMQPGEGGRAYGTRFYLFVHRTMAITALSDNTRVSIRDFSDGDDAANLTLNRNQVYTPLPFGQTYNNYTQQVASVGGFDDDYVEVRANKPVWVFVGPTAQTPNNHSVAPVSIPVGNGQQEAYCFVQKDAQQNNLQIFVDDNTAEVTVTTIAGDQGITTTSRKVGGTGGASWSGPSGGPYWWQGNNFSNELVFIRSTKPMSVFCGGLAGASWQSFLSYETLNSEPEIKVPNNKFKYVVQVGDTLTLNINVTDPNGDTLTWKLSWSTSGGNPPTGASVTGSGNQRILSWTPVTGQEGTYFWNIEVADNGVPRLTTKIQIEIEVVSGTSNRPPTFVSTISPTVAVQLGGTFTYTARAVDPDGDPVTLTLLNPVPGATFNAATGEVSWTASANTVKVGDSFTFTVRACDNKNACTDQTWVVLVSRTNRPPIFVSTPPTSVREGQLLDYTPQVTDPDPGDQNALRFTAVSITDPGTSQSPVGVSVNRTTGRITWTPNSQQGGKSYWVEIVVCDPQGACASQQWSLQVIDVISNPPKITSTPPTKGTVNITYTYAPTFTDADLPNDAHTWTLNAAPSSVRFDTATGRITWSPSAADAGKSVAFELVVCDRNQNCDTQRWSVGVGAANRPPVITSTPPTFSPFVGRVYLYQATATDPDPNEILTWTLLQGPSNAVINRTSGRLEWTPGPGDRGQSFSFNIQVCDRANACDTQSWQTSVQGPNQPPRFTSVPPTSVLQGQSYSYTIVVSDPDPNDTVSVTLTQGPQGASITSSGGNVVLTWSTGSPNGGRTYNFTVRACDQLNNCTEQKWQVFVININDKPVITSTPPTKGTVSVAYLYQPTATDDDPNDTLTWELRQKPANVTVSFNVQTGRLSWTPGPGDDGKSFRFTIRVYDSSRAFAEQTWSVAVTKDTNRGPSITSTAPTTATEDQTYTYSPTATDPDDLPSTLTWTLDQGPASATFNKANGQVSWTPGDSDVTNSPISFKITVCDPGNACDSQSWTVTVANVNDPPKFTSQPSSLTGKVNSIYSYKSTATDPDPGDQGKLVFSLTTPRGNAAMNASTGEFTWTPQPADANQAMTFTLKVCDPQNACDNQTITIKVGKGNSPPQIVSTAPTAAYVNENIAYQAVAVDPDVGDTLSWQLTTGPNNASVDQQSGQVSWTPTINDYGKSVSFTIEVCDDANPAACDKQSFTLKVENKCRLDIQCPGKDICVQATGRFRICVPPGCALVSSPCNPQFFCKDGGCVRDKCPAPNCTTNICRPDSGCIRSCSGVKCPAGSRCVDGSCEPTPCIANACKSGEVCDSSDNINPACVPDPCQVPGQCKHGRLCAYDRCVDDPCKFMKCPTGQICFAGQCQDPTACEVDIDCAGDQVCENKRCVDPNCYTRTPRCQNQGDLCLATSCKEDPCASGGLLQCTADQFCRPTDGKCVAPCDKATQDKCASNETCVDGTCQRDPCAGRSCGAGQTCVGGVCVTDRCSAGNVCKHGRVCNPEENRCQDDPCLYLKCPAGLTCRLGQCVPRGCRIDKDCPGDQICINGECRPSTCPNQPCSPGELCVNGQCTPDPCQGKQCPNGQYCKAGQCVDPCSQCPPGTRCVNGKCVNDPCANVSCPKDQICQNGRCVPECCTEDSCKFNRTCRACQCFDPPCSGIACPNGTACNKDTGNCEPPTGSCDVDKNQCPNDQVCIKNKCEPPGCYTGNACEAGKVCIQGKCVDNPCQGKQCQNNEVCRPVDGQCVPTCNCQPGQVCNNGVCEDDPCSGKTCPQGQVCRNGNCETELPCDKSENADAQICKHGRVCTNNLTNASTPKPNCGDDLCAGLNCPSGFVCRKGQCWPDPCAGENPAESCPSEGGTTEVPTEVPTETTTDGGTVEQPVEVTTVASGGCGCETNPSTNPLALLFLLLGAFVLIRRRHTLAD